MTLFWAVVATAIIFLASGVFYKIKKIGVIIRFAVIFLNVILLCILCIWFSRVQKLHQRWVALRSLLHSKLITPLASISFPVEERTVTRQTRTVLETRLVETNIHFRQLLECTEWCRNKLVSHHWVVVFIHISLCFIKCFILEFESPRKPFTCIIGLLCAVIF